MLCSVIIPVFGQWHLTKNCLLSLKREIDLPFEVILVDNGANALQDDKTRDEAPILGKTLFGDNFVYLPQSENINFAGACNIGAQNAKSPLLFFLNNDTIVIKDFLLPLLEEFQTNQKIMLGPLLMFPPKNSVDYQEHTQKDFSAYTIQHMGVYYSPFNSVGHLYIDLPANHRTTKRKRELQCITGAAFLMRKEDFFALDGFDERFRNGFEDVDLCARFRENGGKIYINPKSKIVHLCSQTPGRSKYEKENASLLDEKNVKAKIYPDWHQLLEEDGYEMHVNEWMSFEVRLNPKLEEKYLPLLATNDLETIKKLYSKEPYLKKAFLALVNHADLSSQEKAEYYLYNLTLNFDYKDYLDYIKLLARANNSHQMYKEANLMEMFESSTNGRLNYLENLLKIPKLPAYFYQDVKDLIAHHNDFMQNTYANTLNEIKYLLTL